MNVLFIHQKLIVMDKKFYIGVTDVSSHAQAIRFLDFFASLSQDKKDPRKLMVGVMMGHGTLHQNPQSRYVDIWPKREDVADIFPSHPYAYNTLHYADFRNITKASDLRLAVAYANQKDTLHALQLDMPWPDTELIRETKRFFLETYGRDLECVLQISAKALNDMETDMSNVVLKVDTYHDLLNHILFDCSGGRGIPVEHEIAMDFLMSVESSGCRPAPALAGGFGPGTVKTIAPMVKHFPHISIDAQGRLRKSGKVQDPLDEDLVFQYLKEAIETFG